MANFAIGFRTIPGIAPALETNWALSLAAHKELLRAISAGHQCNIRTNDLCLPIPYLFSFITDFSRESPLVLVETWSTFGLFGQFTLGAPASTT